MDERGYSSYNEGRGKTMRVTNWYKWTRFKKRLGCSMGLFGIFLGFGIEKGGTSYGVWGILISLAGAYIVSTIRPNEW